MGDPRFFNDIEGMPWAEVQRVKLEKLVRQLRYLQEHSAFYQKKFAAAGVDPAKVARLEDVPMLPFTEKSELRASLKEEPRLGLRLEGLGPGRGVRGPVARRVARRKARADPATANVSLRGTPAGARPRPGAGRRYRQMSHSAHGGPGSAETAAAPHRSSRR